MDVRVNRNVTIPSDELSFTFMPSGGPGGQHANRSSTKVVLEWNVASSRALGPRQKQKVQAALRSRIDSSGMIRLSSDRYRSQLRNRADVVNRLATLVATALRPVKPRTPTVPSASARDRRIREKKHRGDIKRARRRPHTEDD
ncbi:MAG: aminoacyl-tRNA hydrolase [Actinobacteria bacterium]|nr:aminoacyl-tRNA hydrolase [Actinomycetota bacterium]